MSVTATRTALPVPTPSTVTTPDGGVPAFVRQFLPAMMVDPSMPTGTLFNPDKWFEPGTTLGPTISAATPPPQVASPPPGKTSQIPTSTPPAIDDASSGAGKLGEPPIVEGRTQLRRCLSELMRACCCMHHPSGPPPNVSEPPSAPRPEQQQPEPSGKPTPVTQTDDCHSDKRGTYTVKPGDTLSQVAPRYDLTWQQLYWGNRDQIKNPNLIYPGQVLKIPSCDIVPGTIHIPRSRRPHPIEPQPRPHHPKPRAPIAPKPVDPPQGTTPDPSQVGQSLHPPTVQQGNGSVEQMSPERNGTPPVPPTPPSTLSTGLPPALPAR